MPIRLRRALRSALVIVTSLVAAVSHAQGLSQTDRRGPVTVAVTLARAPVGSPVTVRLDTHSVALDGVALETVVVRRGADGIEVAPSAVQDPKGSGHHREALLVFPSVNQPGPGRIVVKGVGGVAERVFAWEWR